MLGMFPIGGAPIADSGDDGSANLNGGLITGTSTLSGAGQLVAAGTANSTGVGTAAGQVVGSGIVLGSSSLVGLAAAVGQAGTISGLSTLSGSAWLVARSTLLGVSTLSAAGWLIGNTATILGLSTLSGEAYYPHYTKWNAEVPLFDFTGADIEESDSAFEQAGRVVLAAQRTILKNKEIWLYWFDPIVGTFVFRKIANGRNPRVLLDDPFDTTNSDILLFYIRTSDQRLVYRQQRDRYLVEYETPAVKAPVSYIDLYLQDVTKGRDGRLVILLARHIINKGRYLYERLESALYPFILKLDSFTASLSFRPGGLLEHIRKTVYVLGEVPPVSDGVPDGYTETDNTRPSQSFVSGLVQKPVIEAGPPGTLDPIGDPVPYLNDVDATKPIDTSFQSGLFLQVLFENILFDIDAFKPIQTDFRSGTLIQVLFTVDLFDVDATTPSVLFVTTGSSLAP
jgi:hypothetical protein